MCTSQDQSRNIEDSEANLQSIIINKQATAIALNQNETINVNEVLHHQGKIAVTVSPEASSHGTNDLEEEREEQIIPQKRVIVSHPG